MQPGEILSDLDAAAMAMHVAKTADIHQNVEAQSVAGIEGARQLIVLAAMPQAEIDEFLAPAGRKRGCAIANLAVGIMGVLIQQRGGQFHFQRIIIQQINQRRGFDLAIPH